jgi:hypothetical protein
MDHISFLFHSSSQLFTVYNKSFNLFTHIYNDF